MWFKDVTNCQVQANRAEYQTRIALSCFKSTCYPLDSRASHERHRHKISLCKVTLGLWPISTQLKVHLVTTLPAVKGFVHRMYVAGALYTGCCNKVYINEVEVKLQCVYKYIYGSNRNTFTLNCTQYNVLHSFQKKQ